MRFIVTVLCLWVLCAGLIWLGIRSGKQQAGYTCLLYNGNQMVDTLTGFLITRRYPPALTRSVYYTITADGRYRVQAAPYTPGRYDRYYLDLIPLGGGDQIRLTDRLSYDYNYVPAPKGSRIAFWEIDPNTAERSYRGVIAEVDASGTVTRQMLSAPSAAGFRHWSPRGDALVMEFPESAQYAIWREDGSLFTYPLQGSLYQDSIFFDQDGDVLFLINNRLTSRTYLYRASPDGITGRTPFHPLSVTNVRHWWSPDQQSLAIAYTTNAPRSELVILRLEDSQVIPWASWEGYTPPQQLEWAPNSQSLVWINENTFDTGTRYNFFKHDLLTGETRLVEEGVTEPPLLAPGALPSRYAITHVHGDKQSVELMDIDGSNRVTVIANADDAGNPYWSDDGSRMAVVWATGQGKVRKVRITVVNRDGGESRTWEGGFWDARELRWLDSDRLAYLTWGGERQTDARFGAEIMDLRDMHPIRLAEDMLEITLFTRSSGSRQVSFWWRSVDERSGISGFDADGERLWQYLVTPGKAASITGIIAFGGNYRVTMPGAPQLFPAPDGKVGAIKLGPYQDESFHLAAPDGSWTHMLREGLYGLGDPLWSPGSTLVAFTQAKSAAQAITLEVFDNEGNFLRQIDYSSLYNALTWTRCD